jgi:hypothetical protein
MALLVTAAYTFVSSQALWQHGPSQLGIAAALYFLVRGREAERWPGVSLRSPSSRGRRIYSSSRLSGSTFFSVIRSKSDAS